jgi:tRNA pseudouridine38-40 synthase
LASTPPAVRLRIDCGYDGSGFSGWAAQPGRRTVEAVLGAALGRVLRLPSPPGLTVAGRTDAGVHARGQVVHADVPAAAWVAVAGGAVARLAGVLPPDVRVHAVGPAPDGFDARFSALWRRYRYRVCDDPAAADPLRRHETLWYFRRLDLDVMNEAALGCLGEHDFAAFCRRRAGASTVRTLHTLEWHRDGDGTAVATVVADAFCHNMVRSLVGALLAVGEGRRPVRWPAEVLAAAVRDPAVRVMPPHALCLEEVGYPPADALAARAAAARQLRAAVTNGDTGLLVAPSVLSSAISRACSATRVFVETGIVRPGEPRHHRLGRAGCRAIDQQEHVGAGLARFGQPEVGHGEAVREEPFAAAEHDRMHHEAVLVDQVVLRERADQRRAARDEDVAVVALLQPGYLRRQVAGDDRGVVPRRVGQGG